MLAKSKIIPVTPIGLSLEILKLTETFLDRKRSCLQRMYGLTCRAVFLARTAGVK
jgi:hypothetical protein